MYLTWEEVCQRRERGSLGIELEGKLLERLELLHEELLLVRAHEFRSFLVEVAVERGQEDLGLVQNEQVQEDTNLAKMVLRPPAAEASATMKTLCGLFSRVILA